MAAGAAGPQTHHGGKRITSPRRKQGQDDFTAPVQPSSPHISVSNSDHRRAQRRGGGVLLSITLSSITLSPITLSPVGFYKVILACDAEQDHTGAASRGPHIFHKTRKKTLHTLHRAGSGRFCPRRVRCERCGRCGRCGEKRPRASLPQGDAIRGSAEPARCWSRLKDKIRHLLTLHPHPTPTLLEG